MKQYYFQKNKALVMGHIGLLRSLGKEGIQAALAREATSTYERYSRYCNEYIALPNLELNELMAVDILEKYASKQTFKPVTFFNAESDVLLFSKYRERLSKYYHIILSSDELIKQLVNKSQFSKLAEEQNLLVPKTLIPACTDDVMAIAKDIGYPFILKPIRQRFWHEEKVVKSLGGTFKAIHINNEKELVSYTEKLKFNINKFMIQEYIPGSDQQHYDFHCYIDKNGTERGHITGKKLRIYPVHFGQGCYTELVDSPDVTTVCLDALKAIGYIGAANINLKLHPETNKYYILEINPRFSLWTILDAACGVNLPLLQYRDSLDLELSNMYPNVKECRWLWFERDRKAMMCYRELGELTFWDWLKSFKFNKKHAFHVFSWDDPLPFIAYFLTKAKTIAIQIYNKLLVRLTHQCMS